MSFYCIYNVGKAIDHVNMCRLFDAASSFTYLTVEFEVADLEEIEELDPLSRLFEFARRARDLANHQQVRMLTFYKIDIGLNRLKLLRLLIKLY